jgi:hypothetical protein
MPFGEHYQPDGPSSSPGQSLAVLDQLEAHAPGIKAFFEKYSGATFGNGVYRIHPVEEIAKWTAIAEEMFPKYKKRIACFGSDWRGVQFALNASRKEEGQFLVQLLDPATAESLNIPANFATFHDVELVEYANDSLATETYEQWLNASGRPPARQECVGYKKPLQLGGEDDIANLEVIDMEVYWSFCTQIQQQSSSLAEGTKLDRVDLE